MMVTPHTLAVQASAITGKKVYIEYGDGYAVTRRPDGDYSMLVRPDAEYGMNAIVAGGVLHECMHIKYTDSWGAENWEELMKKHMPKEYHELVDKSFPEIKELLNACEDVRIEMRAMDDFLGARAILASSFYESFDRAFSKSYGRPTMTEALIAGDARQGRAFLATCIPFFEGNLTPMTYRNDYFLYPDTIEEFGNLIERLGNPWSSREYFSSRVGKSGPTLVNTVTQAKKLSRKSSVDAAMRYIGEELKKADTTADCFKKAMELVFPTYVPFMEENTGLSPSAISAIASALGKALDEQGLSKCEGEGCSPSNGDSPMIGFLSADEDGEGKGGAPAEGKVKEPAPIPEHIGRGSSGSLSTAGWLANEVSQDSARYGARYGEYEQVIASQARELYALLQPLVEAIKEWRESVGYATGKRRGVLDLRSLHKLSTGEDTVFMQRETYDFNDDVGIVTVIDVSGSMESKMATDGGKKSTTKLDGGRVVDNTRLTTSIALGAALVGVASELGKPSGIAGFSNTAEVYKDVGDNNTSIEEVITKAIRHSGGGTCIPAGIRTGMEMVKKIDDDKTKLLVFITDGDYDIAGLNALAERLKSKQNTKAIVLVIADNESSQDYLRQALSQTLDGVDNCVYNVGSTYDSLVTPVIKLVESVLSNDN